MQSVRCFGRERVLAQRQGLLSCDEKIIVEILQTTSYKNTTLCKNKMNIRRLIWTAYIDALDALFY